MWRPAETSRFSSASPQAKYLQNPSALPAMENWHLFTAAFVLSLVDLSVLGAFLWYQFSTLYFAWHLCPMIVNRICELIAFMFTGGMLPSLFAIVQVPLSLFSTTIYANRQQHLQNHLLLAVYCTLLVYESLVALLLIKMGRYLKRPGPMGLQPSRSLPGQQAPQPYIAFHMFALFTQPLGAGCPYINDLERRQDSQVDGFVTVQQPDGKKVMLGKVLQSKLESPMKVETEATKEEGGSKDGHVNVTVAPLLRSPSEEELHHNAPAEVSALGAQLSSLGHIPAPILSGHVNNDASAIQLTSSQSSSYGHIPAPILSGHVNNDASAIQLTSSPPLQVATLQCDTEMSVSETDGGNQVCWQ